MGTQNQDPNRPGQGGAQQKTPPQDPKLNPDRDDDNEIEQRTSDEGQGRDQSASRQRSSGSKSETDSGMPKSGSTDRGQTGTDRSDKP